MRTIPGAAEPTQRRERRATLRVLIVDDIAEIRFLLEVGLSRQADVRLVGQAENGRQALEKADLLRPDLVIMDMQMPEMDGIATTVELTKRSPEIQIVGFTSAGEADRHDSMVRAGAVASFDKTEMKQLLQFVRERASLRARARREAS